MTTCITCGDNLIDRRVDLLDAACPDRRCPGVSCLSECPGGCDAHLPNSRCAGRPGRWYWARYVGALLLILAGAVAVAAAELLDGDRRVAALLAIPALFAAALAVFPPMRRP